MRRRRSSSLACGMFTLKGRMAALDDAAPVSGEAANARGLVESATAEVARKPRRVSDEVMKNPCEEEAGALLYPAAPEKPAGGFDRHAGRTTRGLRPACTPPRCCRAGPSSKGRSSGPHPPGL